MTTINSAAALSSRAARNILYIRTDRLGDVLMNLPAIRVLKQSHPGCRLCVLLDQSLKGLLEGVAEIDEIFYTDASRLLRSWRELWRWATILKKQRFDMGVVSNPHKKLHCLVFLAKIPYRLGYRRKWAFFLNQTLEDKKDQAESHEIESNIALLQSWATVPWDGATGLGSSEASQKKVRALLERGGLAGASLVIIHPGSSSPKKRWPLERFAELCSMIHLKTNHQLILVGGPEEKDRANQLLRMTQAKLHDWTGCLNLNELIAFFQQPEIRTLVSVDSGPVHVAWMSGVPVVALYVLNHPGSNPKRWGPRHVLSQVIYKSLDAVSSEEVFRAVERINQNGDRP